MYPISNYLQRLANWKSLLIFLAIYISFPAYFLKNAEAKINELSGKTIGVIDLTFGFNPQKTLDLVEGYTDAARAYYAQTEMTTDVAYPMVYAFLFSIIITMLFRGQSMVRAQMLPFLTMLFDYAENICIVSLLNTYPQQSIYLATFCEIFKMLKWVSLGSIMIIIVYGLMMKLIKR
ncbi:MAG: hypothetical protein ACOYOA_09455 [Saprospiraceae bacterium]